MEIAIKLSSAETEKYENADISIREEIQDNLDNIRKYIPNAYIVVLGTDEHDHLYDVCFNS